MDYPAIGPQFRPESVLRWDNTRKLSSPYDQICLKLMRRLYQPRQKLSGYRDVYPLFPPSSADFLGFICFTALPWNHLFNKSAALLPLSFKPQLVHFMVKILLLNITRLLNQNQFLHLGISVPQKWNFWPHRGHLSLTITDHSKIPIIANTAKNSNTGPANNIHSRGRMVKLNINKTKTDMGK